MTAVTNALRFQGGGDRVTIPTLLRELTLEAWVRPESRILPTTAKIFEAQYYDLRVWNRGWTFDARTLRQQQTTNYHRVCRVGSCIASRPRTEIAVESFTYRNGQLFCEDVAPVQPENSN